MARLTTHWDNVGSSIQAQHRTAGINTHTKVGGSGQTTYVRLVRCSGSEPQNPLRERCACLCVHLLHLTTEPHAPLNQLAHSAYHVQAQL